MSETLRPSNADGPESGKHRGTGERVRSCCIYLVTVTGLLCMLATWGFAGALTFAVLGTLTGGVVAAAAWTGDHARTAWPTIARTALAVGLAVPAVIGLAAALGFAGVLIALAVAGTTPAVISLVRTRWFAPESRPPADRIEQGPGPAPARPAVRSVAEPRPEPMPELSSLDDEALCLAWRRSFLRLNDARSAAQRLAIVEQRQAYLDELERRSPQGIAAWLAAGARAPGNPLPYVGNARRRL